MIFLHVAISVIILGFGTCSTKPHCMDKSGTRRTLLEEWVEQDRVCICDYSERYLPDPPPESEFFPPEPLCRTIGCVDRFTLETKAPGQTMYNEAFGITCTCVEGIDENVMDKGLQDLYHWNC